MEKAFLIFLLVASQNSFAAPSNRDGELGLGVMIGNTTSINGKFWTQSNGGLDLAVGGTVNKEGMAQLSYVGNIIAPLSAEPRFLSETTLYFGGGAGVGFNREIDHIKRKNDYYIRAPLGVAWMPNRTPVDIFAEVAPTYIFEPTGVFSFVGNVGGR